jgi:type IV secretion system protein TrbF
VVRTSAHAFDIRWEERIFETGAVVKTERFMGVLSIVFKSANGTGAISRNPLGVYVDSFTWRRDPNVRAT